jgi:hypothetical protein
MRPGTFGEEPGFLPCHQAFVSQKIGDQVKFWFLGPVRGTSMPVVK